MNRVIAIFAFTLKLWTVLIFALALSTASVAFAAGPGASTYTSANTLIQLSVGNGQSNYVNSVQIRPVPGQQCPILVYWGGGGTQNLLAVVNPYPNVGQGALDSYPGDGIIVVAWG